jgi:hypothetical protein
LIASWLFLPSIASRIRYVPSCFREQAELRGCAKIELIDKLNVRLNQPVSYSLFGLRSAEFAELFCSNDEPA